MLADTPLIRNLSSPEYARILLKGKDSLASRFAEIDIQQVRQEEKNERRWRKYPKRMCRLFKVPDLPSENDEDGGELSIFLGNPNANCFH